MSRAGKVWRPVLRFVAAVLITSGLMMLADAVLTLNWQEPVSAFIAGREQSSLGHELDRGSGFLDAARRATADERDVRKRVKRLATVWRRHVKEGDAVGRIDLKTLHRRYVVVQGTNVPTLRKGPGHYPATS